MSGVIVPTKSRPNGRFRFSLRPFLVKMTLLVLFSVVAAACAGTPALRAQRTTSSDTTTTVASITTTPSGPATTTTTPVYPATKVLDGDGVHIELDGSWYEYRELLAQPPLRDEFESRAGAELPDSYDPPVANLVAVDADGIGRAYPRTLLVDRIAPLPGMELVDWAPTEAHRLHIAGYVVSDITEMEVSGDSGLVMTYRTDRNGEPVNGHYYLTVVGSTWAGVIVETLVSAPLEDGEFERVLAGVEFSNAIVLRRPYVHEVSADEIYRRGETVEHRRNGVTVVTPESWFDSQAVLTDESELERFREAMRAEGVRDYFPPTAGYGAATFVNSRRVWAFQLEELNAIVFRAGLTPSADTIFGLDADFAASLDGTIESQEARVIGGYDTAVTRFNVGRDYGGGTVTIYTSVRDDILVHLQFFTKVASGYEDEWDAIAAAVVVVDPEAAVAATAATLDDPLNSA